MAETSNKRVNITAEDINQALNDIAEHFKTNAKCYYDKQLKENKGRAETEVKTVLGELAGSWLALALQRFDGGMHYMDTFIGLKLKDICWIETSGSKLL